MTWFGVLLAATLAIHLINFYIRPKGLWSRVLFGLGVFVVIAMAAQFYNAQQRVRGIEEKVVWRDLSPEQRKHIVAKLSSFAGQQYMLIALKGNNAESGNLYANLDHIVEDAGWVKFRGPYPDAAALNKRTQEKGIEIQYAPAREGKEKPVAKVFADALSDEGIAAHVAGNPALDSSPGVITFNVDVKVR